MAEKRTAQLPPIRVTEDVENKLMRLAALDDRKFTDYVRRVLERHVYGHAASLDDGFVDSQFDRA